LAIPTTTLQTLTITKKYRSRDKQSAPKLGLMQPEFGKATTTSQTLISTKKYKSSNKESVQILGLMQPEF
jgi:hypothetical protein